MLEFDADTNQAVLEAISQDWQGHTLIAGILYHNGTTVTINPPTKEHPAQATATFGYTALPDWAKNGTADQAELTSTGRFGKG